MRNLLAALGTLSLATTPAPQFIKEPKTGVLFATRVGDMSLLGVGLRTKTFLKIKVYAIGLYVADSALSGPLARHKGELGASAFYRDLVAGDFEKQLVLKLVRDLSAEQIQGAFRTRLPSAVDRRLLDQFLSYFPETKEGQECVLRWTPEGILETSVAGVVKPPITDKAFAQAVFAIWLGESPLEAQMRKRLVSRASELIK